uniref:Uncharacterized protein n=1 Tax=Chromera velia CCMP2878 TaxID=1169474 RepID=A0A0G4IC26_9ALVE|eukprot:Cvel_12902.t1-p1 / transcript=Cvel_12902.t1 / gene=Cvel_12902 / organism=Chromera_velia_CCMP2878 / gene_product=hypothetical protein / transcript_product=hypothetical protein / location=Cvel_scaffold862:19528-21733(-) / protein_length=578 / sequence_SO=supercontig / SO=protein_coding / is_pseudo=false
MAREAGRNQRYKPSPQEVDDDSDLEKGPQPESDSEIPIPALLQKIKDKSRRPEQSSDNETTADSLYNHDFEDDHDDPLDTFTNPTQSAVKNIKPPQRSNFLTRPNKKEGEDRRTEYGKRRTEDAMQIFQGCRDWARTAAFYTWLQDPKSKGQRHRPWHTRRRFTVPLRIFISVVLVWVFMPLCGPYTSSRNIQELSAHPVSHIRSNLTLISIVVVVVVEFITAIWCASEYAIPVRAAALLRQLYRHYSTEDDRPFTPSDQTQAWKDKWSEENQILYIRAWEDMLGRSQVLYRSCVVAHVFLPVTVLALHVILDVLPGTSPLRFYWICHALLAGLVMYPAVAAAATIVMNVSTICNLTALNIQAMRELIDVICLRVLVIEKGVEEGGKTDNEIRVVVQQEKKLNRLRRELRVREQFLRGVARTTWKCGSFASWISLLTLFNVIFHILAVVELYIVFAHLRQDEHSAPRWTIVLLVAIPLSLLANVQPFLAMAKQGRAFNSLLWSLKSLQSQRAAELLSPKGSPKLLLSHFRDLEDEFTWTVLGFHISFRAIYRAIAAYSAAIWAVIVIPYLPFLWGTAD